MPFPLQTRRALAEHIRSAPRPGFLLLGLCVLLASCASGGGEGTPPPPPPPQVTVSITPGSGAVLLGDSLTFAATVTNAANTSVTWSINGAAGGSAQLGTISTAGVYTAPADLPASTTVQVVATSVADPSKSASASVTIQSDVSVSIAPGASSVELGASQAFRASLSSSGHPDPAVRWSLSGTSCPSACGIVDASGNYTAPGILPASASVVVVATSVADPSRQTSATIAITSHFTLQLSAPGTLQTGSTAAVVATLTPVPGSHPNATLSWSLSGPGCSGTNCGVLSAITAQSASSGAIVDTVNYTSPAAPPQPATVIITATPLADASKQTQAIISIQGGAVLSLTPVTATLAANHRLTLTVSEAGIANDTFSWSVNGIPAGNAALGQVCAVAASPCQPISTTSATQVDFVAPGAMPSPNPVSVQVSSVSNPLLSASAQVTVINHVLVSILPNSVTLPPLGVQAFAASVLGTANQAVVWQIQGAGCGSPGACGAITPAGAYTAPAAAPSPDALQVVATSLDDETQSASANVSISTGANILSLHPASVYAGAAQGFTLAVDGSGFVPSSLGPGSVLVIAGTPRVTLCASANNCSAPVTAADVAQAGAVSVTVQSPSLSGSNTVSIIVLAPSTTDAVISLTTASPSSTGNNITVVEPTTAGVDTSQLSVDLSVAAAGTFLPASSTCNLGGDPIPLLRPASGTGTADICIFSEAGFDTSMNYWISGPGDVAVISKQPAGLGIIHLTLQVPAAAAPGPRTLFVENTNLDETSASGILNIE